MLTSQSSLFLKDMCVDSLCAQTVMCVFCENQTLLFKKEVRQGERLEINSIPVTR